MLQTIRIQNFRSLKDVTLSFQDVNLLIGPNNSGKSNLMKALVFLGDLLGGKKINHDELERLFFLKKVNNDGAFLEFPPISFTIAYNNNREGHLNTHLYKIELHGFIDGNIICNEFVGLLNEDFNKEKIENIDLSNISELKTLFYDFSLSNYWNDTLFDRPDNLNDPTLEKLLISNDLTFNVYWKVNHNDNNLAKRRPPSKGQLLNRQQNYTGLPQFFKVLHRELPNTDIYTINISNLKKPYPTLENDYTVNSDASNLVAFLDNMRDSHIEVIQNINESLNECIKEFKSIIFDKVVLEENHALRKIYGNKTFKRIGVQDQYGEKYWADELSDGTLYFLALLGIIHQPNPPKLLMIEEPENGIHPRRIKEIVDFIFDLTESKNIQVIMTTHSPVLIDQFKDLPESIYVFDKSEEATTIKNLQYDIIAEDKKQSEKLNLPEIDLSGSLGDHWASGLIGGVPR